jgi:hypothetical protein
MDTEIELTSQQPATPAVGLHGVVRPLRGLERICKLYGRMKCGSTMMVWDYANEVALPEKEMPAGSKRWAMSEKAKWSNTKSSHAGAVTHK